MVWCGAFRPDGRIPSNDGQRIVDDARVEQKPAWPTRYLRVHNDTGENLRVYIQYYTPGDQGRWRWLPGDLKAPSSGQFVMVECPKDGQTEVQDRDTRVDASRVRVWAISESGKKWEDFRDKDLEVVPERNDKDEPSYLAAIRQTYPLSFTP
jgi:hypothetical protein